MSERHGQEPRVPEDYLGLAVIGGSGTYTLARETFGRPVGTLQLVTPFGVAAPVHFLRPPGADCTLALLSRHGESGYEVAAPDVNYRANIWALKELGTERIIAWSGPGSVNPTFMPGDYVLPDDLLDLTTRRESTFLQGTGLGFIRQHPVFCPVLRGVLVEAAALPWNVLHAGGVYAVSQGPRLETPAEVRMIARLGGELVGMTLAPEAFLARELEICYHPLCYVTNWAEGVKEAPYRAGELFEGMLEPELRERVAQAVRGFPQLALRALELVRSRQEEERDCPCSRSMLRYRKAGRIGEDWHSWISVSRESAD